LPEVRLSFVGEEERIGFAVVAREFQFLELGRAIEIARTPGPVAAAAARR
jgi:hypothetical protein